MGDDLIDREAALAAAKRVCTICGQEKDESEFYFRRSSGRFRADCKDCKNKRNSARYSTTAYKLRKRELSRRNRGNDVNRAREIRSAANYLAKYPEKSAAKRAVRRAVESGILIRPEKCQMCNSEFETLDGRAGIHAHHPDYSKPLDVMWLCPICHAKEHSNAKG